MSEPMESTEDAAARPIPATIPMPDHPVRQTAWYQLYVRAARPAMNWVVVAAAANALFNEGIDDTMRGTVLIYALVVLGIRTAEKVKGVA